jgi:type IV pilus assembly protein PilX
MTIKTNFCLRDQSGAALVIALIIMIVLTVIALASSFTSIFEIKLSGNKRGMTDAFYAADGGVQAVLPLITNFNTSSYTLIPNSGSLPQDLLSESIDSANYSPTFSLPSGVNFIVQPNVDIYHTTITGAPRNSGSSATGSYEYSYYIIHSNGVDQIDSSLIPSNCQVREKVVRLLPTSQGGN